MLGRVIKSGLVLDCRFCVIAWCLLVVSLEIVEERSVDDVGESALEAAHGLEGGLAGFAFAEVVVVPAGAGRASESTTVNDRCLSWTSRRA